MGKYLHGGDCPLYRRRLQPVLGAHAFAQPYRIFLVIDQIVGAVGIDMHDNQSGRVRAQIDNGNTLRHGCTPLILHYSVLFGKKPFRRQDFLSYLLLKGGKVNMELT